MGPRATGCLLSPARPSPTLHLTSLQTSDTVVPDQTSANVDLESNSDPFHFKGALKTSAEIDELRRRKKGKRLAAYHGNQNTVRLNTTISCRGPTNAARVAHRVAA